MKRAAVVLTCASLLLGCSQRSDVLDVAGTIEIREISIAAMTSGRLLSLLKDEGDTVWTGDTIAMLTQPGLPERISELEARHGALVARARDLEAGARPQELAAASAATERALADSTRAAIDAERARELLSSDAAAEAEWDAARTAADAASARVRETRAALRLLEAGARRNQVAASWREAEAAAAALAAVRATQEELTVTSPADGIILLRLAERGEVIPTAAPIVILGLTREPWIRAFVGQPFISRVTLGANVDVIVSAYPDTTFGGSIVEINPDAEFTPRAALTERDRADLVFGIKVGIDDAGGRLKPGMPVDLIIHLAPAP